MQVPLYERLPGVSDLFAQTCFNHIVASTGSSQHELVPRPKPETSEQSTFSALDVFSGLDTFAPKSDDASLQPVEELSMDYFFLQIVYHCVQKYNRAGKILDAKAIEMNLLPLAFLHVDECFPPQVRCLAGQCIGELTVNAHLLNTVISWYQVKVDRAITAVDGLILMPFHQSLTFWRLDLASAADETMKVLSYGCQKMHHYQSVVVPPLRNGICLAMAEVLLRLFDLSSAATHAQSVRFLQSTLNRVQVEQFRAVVTDMYTIAVSWASQRDLLLSSFRLMTAIAAISDPHIQECVTATSPLSVVLGRALTAVERRSVFFCMNAYFERLWPRDPTRAQQILDETLRLVRDLLTQEADLKFAVVEWQVVCRLLHSTSQHLPGDMVNSLVCDEFWFLAGMSAEGKGAMLSFIGNWMRSSMAKPAHAAQIHDRIVPIVLQSIASNEIASISLVLGAVDCLPAVFDELAPSEQHDLMQRLLQLVVSVSAEVAMRSLVATVAITRKNMAERFPWMMDAFTRLLSQFGYNFQRLPVDTTPGTWAISDHLLTFTLDQLCMILHVALTLGPSSVSSTYSTAWIHLLNLLEAELFVWSYYMVASVRSSCWQILELLASPAIRHLVSNSEPSSVPLFSTFSTQSTRRDNADDPDVWIQQIEAVFESQSLLPAFAGRMAWIFQHVRKVWDFNTCGLPKQTDATAHQLAWLRLRLICRCARSSAHADAALSPDFLGEQFDDDAQLGEFFKGVFRLLEYRHRSVYFMVIDVLTAVHESVSQPAVSSIIEVVNGWLARTDNADASAPRPGAQFRSHFLEASLELLLQLFYGGTGGILKAPQISVPILMEFVEAWAMVRLLLAALAKRACVCRCTRPSRVAFDSRSVVCRRS
jgi:hypothetical protein